MNFHVAPTLDLPANIEAEQALLGAILVNNDAFHEVAARGLEDYHFSEAIHAEIYSACGKVIEAGGRAYPVTVKSYLPEMMVGGMTVAQYLARLTVEAVSIVNAPDFASTIILEWSRRECIACGAHFQEAGRLIKDEGTLLEEIKAVSDRLDAARVRLSGGSVLGQSFADFAAQSLQATADAMAGKVTVGIEYGFPALHQLIGPMRPGTFIVIGGMTKHGKSSVAQQVARGAAEKGHSVLYYSGEMSKLEILQRELARDTGISTDDQARGRLSDRDLERLTVSMKTISKLPITVQDKRMSLDMFCRAAKSFANRSKTVPLIIADSILLFDRAKSEFRMSKVEYAEYASDRLKALAREIDAVVIALAQLKKNTIERDRRASVKRDAAFYTNLVGQRPAASDIYGSVEKDTDHVILVFNPEVILLDCEPAEGTEEHLAWEEVLAKSVGRAEIKLALSRSAEWPRLRNVRWDGRRHHFSFPSDQQRGLF